MAADERPRHAAAARLRGPRPRALVGPPRALPADVRGRQYAGGQLHDPGQLFPHPAPPDSPDLPQAADHDDAEIPAAPSALHLGRRRFHRRLDLPPRPVG